MTNTAKKPKDKYRGRAWIRKDTNAVITSIMHNCDSMNTIAVLSQHLEHAGLTGVVGVVFDPENKAIAITALDPRAEFNPAIGKHRNYFGHRIVALSLDKSERVRGVAAVTPSTGLALNAKLIGFVISVAQIDNSYKLVVTHGVGKFGAGEQLRMMLTEPDTEAALSARGVTRTIVEAASYCVMSALHREVAQINYDNGADSGYVTKPVADIAEAFAILRDQLFLGIDDISKQAQKTKTEANRLNEIGEHLSGAALQLMTLAVRTPSMRRAQQPITKSTKEK